MSCQIAQSQAGFTLCWTRDRIPILHHGFKRVQKIGAQPLRSNVCGGWNRLRRSENLGPLAVIVFEQIKIFGSSQLIKCRSGFYPQSNQQACRKGWERNRSHFRTKFAKDIECRGSPSLSSAAAEEEEEG